MFFSAYRSANRLLRKTNRRMFQHPLHLSPEIDCASGMLASGTETRVALSITFLRWTLPLTVCLAEAALSNGQVTEPLPDAPTQYSERWDANGGEPRPGSQATAEPGIYPQESLAHRLRDVPRRILLGSAVPREKALYSLNREERLQVYLKQTYFSSGAYFERALGAGYDQARGAPSTWGGGMEGLSKRFASRYGQFVIRNTLKSAGDAALGYEPRYDLCRCDGFWNRTKHAIIRDF